MLRPKKAHSQHDFFVVFSLPADNLRYAMLKQKYNLRAQHETYRRHGNFYGLAHRKGHTKTDRSFAIPAVPGHEKGLVSYRTGKDGRREFDTSELIRAYGELRTEETVKRHKKGQQEIDDTPAEHPQLKEIQQQLTALQQTVTLMLEDKSTREAELRQHDEERTQLLAEISRLNEDLEQEKKRSLWSRLFRRDIEEKNREK